MIWRVPHPIKIYEAVTAVLDMRIKIDETDNHLATCMSSSGNKEYLVRYDPASKSIMANDNSAYFQKRLSYPMIAYLMTIGAISYEAKSLKELKGIPWKKINTRYKNDYDKAINGVMSGIKDRIGLEQEIERIYQQLKKIRLSPLLPYQKPPKGFIK